jgi:hypothetical protein
LIDANEVREHVDLQLHRLDRAFNVAASLADDSAQPPELRLRAIDRVVRRAQGSGRH